MGLRWLLCFSNQPTSPKTYETHNLMQNGYQIQIKAIATLRVVFGVHINNSSITNVKILVCLSNDHIYFSIHVDYQTHIGCLSYFEHAIQCLLNTCHFGICSWSHTKPHVTQTYIAVVTRKTTQYGLSTSDIVAIHGGLWKHGGLRWSF